METDQKIQQTFKLFVDNDAILNLEMLGGVNDVASNVRQAELIRDNFFKIFSQNSNQKFNCLISLSGLGPSAHYPSPQSRQIFAQLIEDKQLNKIAVYAPSILLQAIMRFIIYVSNKKDNMQFFQNKDQALNWLKETE